VTLADVETGILSALVSILTTLVGVLIGFGLTLRNDRKKKKDEEIETRSRIAKAIRTELEANLGAIGAELEAETKEQKTELLILFPATAYESAKSGGFISLFKPELQYSLGVTYTAFRWIETVSQRVLSMVGSTSMSLTNYADSMKRFQAIMDSHMALVQEKIPDLLNRLKSEESVSVEKKKRRWKFWKRKRLTV